MSAGTAASSHTATRCLIADDQAMVREVFAAALDAQPGLLAVGQAADGADAVSRLNESDASHPVLRRSMCFWL